MIIAQNNLIGRISAKQNITGKLNNAVVREYPELEDLTVTPSAEEQHFKSEKYGYNNVTVKAVEGEELNIIPSTETQVKEGLYNKVIVQGDSNLIADNIKEGTEIFGVQGSAKVNDNNAKISTSIQIRNSSNELGVVRLIEEVPEITLLNFGTHTRAINLFKNCQSLKKAPFIDTSKVSTASSMFYDCQSLKEIPQYDTKKFTACSSIFYNCISLETIPKLDLSSCMLLGSNSFYNCSKLTNLGGFINLGKGYTQKRNNYSNYILDLSYCVELTHDSLMNVINNLYDLNLTYNVAGGGTLYTQQLILGSTNIAKLTAEEIAIATNKRLDSFLERREYEIFFLYKTKNDSSR